MNYQEHFETKKSRKTQSSNDITVIEVNKKQDPVIKFNFPHISYDENVTFNYASVINACPLVRGGYTTEMKDKVVDLPQWVLPKDFMEYIYIWNNGYDHSKLQKVNFSKILEISEFFENFDYSAILIKEMIINNIDKLNCCSLLIVSYEKLGYCSENAVGVNPSWFDLFYTALDIMSKNILYYLDDEEQMEKIHNMNKKILEELIEKSFSFLILNNFSITDEKEDTNFTNNYRYDSSSNKRSNSGKNFISLEDYEKIIQFLFKLRKVNNIYDLLTNEYLSLSSEDSIQELAEIPNPTFSVNIPKDFNNYNYYNEFPIEIGMNKIVVFVVYYKKTDDSLNVSFKLNQNGKDDDLCFKIFTFLSVVSIDDDKTKNQVNVRSLCNNKSMYQIFKMNNFKQHLKDKDKSLLNNNSSIMYDYYKPATHHHNKNSSLNNFTIKDLKDTSNSHNRNISEDSFVTHSEYGAYGADKKNETFNLKINLRICFLHTAMASYLLRNFTKTFDHPNINKISGALLKIILKNKSLNKENEDQVVHALINWCKILFLN